MAISKTKLAVVSNKAEEEKKPPHIFDPEFKWSRGSDVQKTWRKFGWVPPTETKFKHIYDHTLTDSNIK